jgi:stearoyl-CoA desaturase (delta-9 desaturase)
MDAVRTIDRQHWLRHYFNFQTTPFWATHVGAVVAIWQWGFSWTGLGLAVALYYVRMFFVTGVYHRYFSHRAYKTSRFVQFLFAFFGGMSVQKGALWWAGHHRHHHKFSDTLEDLHSAKQDGLLWSHVGWIVSRENNETREDLLRDFTKYPELVWLDKYHLVPVAAYAGLLYAFGGGFALIWGFLVSTVLLWHGTFTINSLSHIFGKRRYQTTDDSKNNWFLALITMGEGWHNNHHYYQSTANQGFYWWEIDLSYYVLLAMARVGLIWDLRTPPKWVLEEGLGKVPAKQAMGRGPAEHGDITAKMPSVAPDAA